MVDRVEVGDRIRWTYLDRVKEMTVVGVSPSDETWFIAGADLTVDGEPRPNSTLVVRLKSDCRTHVITDIPVEIIGQWTPIQLRDVAIGDIVKGVLRQDDHGWRDQIRGGLVTRVVGEGTALFFTRHDLVPEQPGSEGSRHSMNTDGRDLFKYGPIPTTTDQEDPMTHYFRGSVPGIPGTDVLVRTSTTGTSVRGEVVHVYSSESTHVTVESDWSFDTHHLTPSPKPFETGDRVKIRHTPAVRGTSEVWMWKGTIESIDDTHHLTLRRTHYNDRPDAGRTQLTLNPDHLGAENMEIEYWEESEMSDSTWVRVDNLHTLRPGDWIKGHHANEDLDQAMGGRFTRLDEDGDPSFVAILDIRPIPGQEIGDEDSLSSGRTWYRLATPTPSPEDTWIPATEPLAPGTEFQFYWADGTHAYDGVMLEWRTINDQRRVRVTAGHAFDLHPIGWEGNLDSWSPVDRYRVRSTAPRPLAVGDIIRGPAGGIRGDFTARVTHLHANGSRVNARLIEIHEPSTNGRPSDEDRMRGDYGYWFRVDEVVRVGVTPPVIAEEVLEPVVQGRATSFTTLLEAKKAVHEYAVSKSSVKGGPQCIPGTNAFLSDLGLPSVHREVQTPDERAEIAAFMAEVRTQVINHQDSMGRTSADQYLADWGLEPITQPTKTVMMTFTVPGNTTLDAEDIRDRVRRVVRSAENIDVAIRQNS